MKALSLHPAHLFEESMSVVFLSPASPSLRSTPLRPLWAASELRALDAQEIGERTARGAGDHLQASISLMNDAGRALSREIIPLLAEHGSRIRPAELSVLVGVGPRNNGGDGWVVARHLREAGYTVSILCAAAATYSPEWHAVAQEWVAAQGLHAVSLIEPSEGAYSRSGLPPFLSRARVLGAAELGRYFDSRTVFIDALLGIGQTAPPREPIATVLREARLRQLKHLLPSLLTIAIDVPTGVDADSGGMFTPSLPAHHTLAIHGLKRGCALEPARTACGEVTEVPILELAATVECQLLVALDPVALPLRRPDGHKGTYGHVMVLGGSQEMPGAPVMAAHAALRAGAGLVTKVEVPLATSSALWPEIMRVQLSGGDVFGPEHVAEIERLPRQPTSYVVGPGIGRHPGTFQFLEEFLVSRAKVSPEVPVVLDADALTFLATERTFELCGENTILTPHYGEAARILGCEGAAVIADPFGAAARLVALTGACVVLKGAGTIVAHHAQRYVIAAGTPYLATAGSGDVLAGIIAAVLASDAGNMALAYRVAQAVFLHAEAGATAARQRQGPIIAADIIEQIGISTSGGFLGLYRAPSL